MRGELVLELGVVPGGYGWVFPKGDHVNVGVGGWSAQGPRLRRHLARLCREHGIPERAWRTSAATGCRCGARRDGRPRARRRSSATPPASSTRSPATGSTRRSSARGSRRRTRSTSSPAGGRISRATQWNCAAGSQSRQPRRGGRRWHSTASRARRFTLLRAPLRLARGSSHVEPTQTTPRTIGGPGGAALRAAELLARVTGDPGKAFAA